MVDIPFIKMHGLGNDFVLIEKKHSPFLLSAEIAQKLCNRHRGIGCDQLIYIEASDRPDIDFIITFYNRDGSISSACGNGSRCVAGWYFEQTGKNNANILVKKNTYSKLGWKENKDIIIHAKERSIGEICVDMGKPYFLAEEIPINTEFAAMIPNLLEIPLDHPLLIDHNIHIGSAVGMGNPHFVLFHKNVSELPIEKIGDFLETHPLFPERTNVEFATVLSPNHIKMRVWERGAGVTEACGSGACAVAVIAQKLGFIEENCLIDLDGGSLKIDWKGNDTSVFMTGGYQTVFKGFISEDLLI
jgi:diaminopimelate epimerase